MKSLIKLSFLFFTSILFSQQTIVSGEYDAGLKLTYNSSTNKLTGYFEQYTGENNNFSCVFYIEGTVEGKQFKIKTYYPGDKPEDIIEGTLEISNNKFVKIQLPEEHGGCWNVQHFKEEPVDFKLEKEANWIQIGYVVADKAYFFKDKTEESKAKAYLVKDNFVCIEKIEGEWAYCLYFGNKTIKGWIKIKDLNQP